VLLVITDSMSDEIGEELSRLDVPWKVAAYSDIASTTDHEWAATVIVAQSAESALSTTAELRALSTNHGSVVAVLPSAEIASLGGASSVTFDDLALLPLHDGELAMRIARVLHTESSTPSETASYGSITLNLSTYQASVDNRPLDMTYMEYELLRHFVSNPRRVLSREELLRDVWRYEYYGGARTVDVHVRRLRAKLGEEHAQLIQTVRSVGYMFGRDR
jgi:DNA-binding response OmpR family regulator